MHDQDTLCPSCEYNLKGVRVGSPCPECGFVLGDVLADTSTQITGFWGWVLRLFESGHTPGLAHSMTDAPPAYLQQLAMGCRAMQIALALALVLPAGALVGMKFMALDNTSIWRATAMCMVVPAGLWTWGVWVVTAPRQTRTLNTQNAAREWRSTRWAARLTQLGWIAGSAVLCLTAWSNLSGAAIPGPAWARMVAFGVPSLIASVGLCWVTLYAARLAEWGNDIDMADRLRLSSLAVFGAPPIICLSVLMALNLDESFAVFFASVLGLLASLLPLLWLAQLVHATIQFTNMGQWAQVNAETIMQRDQRLRAKAQRMRAEAAAAGLPEPPKPIASMLHTAGPDAVKPTPLQAQRIAKTTLPKAPRRADTGVLPRRNEGAAPSTGPQARSETLDLAPIDGVAPPDQGAGDASGARVIRHDRRGVGGDANPGRP